MRKTNFLIYTVIFLFIFFSKSLYSYDVDINLKTSIKRMISTQELSQLSFGETMITSNAGSIIVPATSKQSVVVTGGHQYLKNAKAGVIKIIGEKDSQVFVSISPSGIISGKDGSSLNVDYKVNTNKITLNNKGEAEIFTHGTLNIKENTRAGVYKGTYTITFKY